MSLPSEQRQQQREDDTQDDRRRDGKIKGKIVAPDGDIAGEPPDREAEHDEKPDAGDDQTDQNEEFSHRFCSGLDQLHAGEKVPDFIRGRFRRI